MAFYLAGIPPLVGGAMLCLIPWVERRRKAREAAAAADGAQKMLEYKRDSSGGHGDGKSTEPESVI